VPQARFGTARAFEVAAIPPMTGKIVAHHADKGALDLHKSSCAELQIARIYTRKQTTICLASGYNSDDDNSDDDEQDGQLITERQYHDNGNQKHFRTYQQLPAVGGSPPVQRVVEEKHFDVGGVCRLDVHFGLGQPYLSRKHFYENQRLKSEQLFFVEDERTMASRKAGHWREYYPGGNVKSEVVYDGNGMRCGFCKRYGEDGTVLWVKDYTKEYQARVDDFNTRKGLVDLSNIDEAAQLLGFKEGKMPQDCGEVDRMYRKRCLPLHPDKTPDPDAAERFIEVSRAREVLLKHLAAAAA
jgi:antitoxin component YwqK of YwqJK toxin-antitoxin module